MDYYSFLDSTDKLDDRAKLFFLNARKQKTPERDAEFEAIRSEYYKVLEDAGKERRDKGKGVSLHSSGLVVIADEKVHQANQMHELVEKYVRKLDQELLKFKMELEADNAGITEVLERREWSEILLLLELGFVNYQLLSYFTHSRFLGFGYVSS